jgi:hypothetical protein
VVPVEVGEYKEAKEREQRVNSPKDNVIVTIITSLVVLLMLVVV